MKFNWKEFAIQTGSLIFDSTGKKIHEYSGTPFARKTLELILGEEEIKEMVMAIRDIEKALGTGIKQPVAAEEEIKRVARRSVVAIVDILEGTLITREMLDIRRPGTGIEPNKLDTVIGKRTRRHIKSGELITFANLQ